MNYKLSHKTKSTFSNQLFFVKKVADLKQFGLSASKIKLVKENLAKLKLNRWHFNDADGLTLIVVEEDDLEGNRKNAHECFNVLNNNKMEEVHFATNGGDDTVFSFLEGLLLSTYTFEKYKSEKSNQHLHVQVGAGCSKEVTNVVQALVSATMDARDLVNEPHSYLNATNYSKEIKRIGKRDGFKVEVFNKKKIESLKMGGVLAVNKGSVQPPTFNILEWKPKKATNKQPIVLVGKGVVYDTGGLSLKPTPNSMDIMKCDMGGSAAVVGALSAISKLQLPVHVIGLIPATDNRPGLDAVAPGDVITMYSGKTVEVLNTDAEGRLILADALHYAKKYKPQLVIDLATLTGAAVAAIGPQGIVTMGNASEEVKNKLKNSGEAVYERLVEFPMWKEYGEMLKSEVADIKNLGGPYAGAITAGKFLEHFVDYPWMHMDIAGAAYLRTPDSYRGKNGTGVAVRLLFNFLQNEATASRK